jgi:hypothetical protein
MQLKTGSLAIALLAAILAGFAERSEPTAPLEGLAFSNGRSHLNQVPEESPGPPYYSPLLSPPFEARLIDNELGQVLMGRGATNQKGPERALLNAIASSLAVDGTLPVNLMVAAEGEEELGSPNYPQIVDAYEARLREADGVIFPFNSQDQTGEFEMSLGVKGILHVEMEASGGPHGGPVNAEIHGSYKAVVGAPALRLVHAISSLTTPDGNTILVPGYYDAVRAPTLDEQRMINAMAREWNDTLQQRLLGVERWIDGATGRDAILRYLYDPMVLDLYVPALDGLPVSASTVELGRTLFFAARLSADGSLACASCHLPDRAFAGAGTVAIGGGGRRGSRNVPALINRGYGEHFSWDGRGAFKTPTRREVERTAPYMHDGSIPTLEEVVEFYNDGGITNPNIDRRLRPLGLSPAEDRALVAFLRSLSGVVREGGSNRP